MRFLRDAIVTIVALIGVVAVAGYLLLGNFFSASGRPGRVESFAAVRLRNLSIPGDASRTENPFADRKDAYRDALDHFGDHCAICHAGDGRGGAEIGQRLNPPAPDMTRARTQNLTDGELFYIIENGVRFTGMPAWKGEHTPEETWRLVSLIRHLPRLTPDELEAILKASGENLEMHGHEEKGQHGEPK